MGPHGKEPELVYEFSYRAQIKPPLDIGPGPFGHRMIFEVTEGVVEGERLSGVMHSGGGEWFLAGPDGFGRVDVRAQVTTDDGANIYFQYFGLLELNERTMGAIGAGAGTEFEDHYFRTNPRLETGDPRYAWVNQTVFVGKGHVLPGLLVEYDVYRVT
jgi:Protein of unknown function (DUF3237)